MQAGFDRRCEMKKILIVLALGTLCSAQALAQWKHMPETETFRPKLLIAHEEKEVEATVELAAKKKERLFLGFERESGGVTQRFGFRPKKSKFLVIEVQW